MGPAVVGTREEVETALVVVVMGPAAVATELGVVVVKEPAAGTMAEELEPEEARKALEAAAAATGPTRAVAKG